MPPHPPSSLFPEMSSSIALLANAILSLNEGKPLPSSITDALRELCPAVAEPAAAAAAPEPEPEPAAAPAPVKEKKVRKISKAVAAAAAAAPAAAAEPVAAAEPAAAVAEVAKTDDWRKHPSRLQTIDSTRCTGRKIDTKNPLEGTREEGMIFPERQCTKKPSPGSKLCTGCATKDAEYKANPNKNNANWHGRLDEETLYPRAKIVGSDLFLKRYPNGIPTAPVSTTAEHTVAAAEPTVAAAKRAPKKTDMAKTTVAVDVAPVVAKWRSFQYDGRTHIRNLETNKVYYANMTKDSPEANAVKEQYVGRWVEDRVELLDDSDDDEE